LQAPTPATLKILGCRQTGKKLQGGDGIHMMHLSNTF